MALFSLLALLVAAAPGNARLAYDAANTTCPDRAQLISGVTSRLGYAPFRDDAADAVDVRVVSEGASLLARVLRLGPTGESGRRELRSPTLDCSELFRALELAVVIAIDPKAALARPPPREPAPPAPPPIVVVAPPPVTPAEPVLVHVGLAPIGSLGSAPSPTFGVGVLAGLRRGLFELVVGGRVDFPSTLALSPGVITTQVISGNLGPCLAVWVLRGCVVAELGALRVTSSGLTPSAQKTVFLSNLGGRLALEVGLFKHVVVRPFIDVAASLARTSLVADSKVVWVTPGVVGSVGVAVAFSSR